MKIINKNKFVKDCEDLIINQEENMDVASLYCSYLFDYNKRFLKKDILKKKSELHLKHEEEALYYCLLDRLDVDYDDEDFKIVEKKHNLKNLKKLDVKKYLNNPYYLNISFKNIKEKKWEFTYSHYNAYELFIYNDITIKNDYLEETNLGYFEEEFVFPLVKQNNTTWMSITPHEINTMEKDIQDAHGNVLVFGLGLGYFPYMISLKNEVKSITIIEKDETIIELFKKYLLTQFVNQDKIQIIHSDAFDYMKKINSNFDYVYFDLYHDADDGIFLYIKMKQYENKFNNLEVKYWIEETLLSYLRRMIIILLEENLDDENTYNYEEITQDSDIIKNKLYLLLKDYKLDTRESLINLLSKNSLRKIAKDLSLLIK